MANPLFNMLAGNTKMPGKFGNLQNLIQQFQQFKQTFNGSPMQAQQQVQAMLNSGRISQADYNNAMQLATQLMQMMKH